MRAAITINGRRHEADVEPRLMLVDFIRTVAGLTGTKIGCDTSNCGACTVLLGGMPVKSCTMLAVQADGLEVSTIEGLRLEDGSLHPVQQAFKDAHGLQCGYCTPGMVLMATALLHESRDPSEAEIREWITGNLCRCTGSVNIVKAIRLAASRRKQET